MLGEAADQLDRVLGQPAALGAAGVERDAEFGAGAAFPADLDVGAPLGGVDGDDRRRGRACAAVPCGRGRWSSARPRAAADRARAARARARSSSVSGAGRACSSAASLPRSRSTRGERVLERAFEGARDEPVLGLAGVELAARAVGLELGALEREALAGEPLVVLVLQLARPRRRSRRRRPGVTASRNAAATAWSRRPPPSDWQVWSVRMQHVAAHARIAADACRRCRNSRPACAGRSARSAPGPAAARRLRGRRRRPRRAVSRWLRSRSRVCRYSGQDT